MKYHDKFLPHKIYNINKPSLSESSSSTRSKQSKNSNSKHDRSKERD